MLNSRQIRIKTVNYTPGKDMSGKTVITLDNYAKHLSYRIITPIKTCS